MGVHKRRRNSQCKYHVYGLDDESTTILPCCRTTTEPFYSNQPYLSVGIDGISTMIEVWTMLQEIALHKTSGLNLM
jgi:hypothetical protein